MSSHKRGDRLAVDIQSLAIGGRGVAKHDGLVIFIPDTAPDERVEIELTKVKKNFAEGRLIQILRASPHRRIPRCAVAGVCGGCNWQHIDYQEQLKQKRQFVEQSLRKFSGFNIVDNFVEPVVPSPKEFRYRNRIQLHHDLSRSIIGFHKRNSHEIVNIDDCLITEEDICAEISTLRKVNLAQPPGRIEILREQTGQITTRQTYEPSKPTIEDDKTNSESTAHAFSQVNTLQNKALVEFVVDAIADFFNRSIQ